MLRKFLKSKIHRATVTQADLEYEGSLTLPPELMKAADIHPYEAIQVWNVTRGSRIETYAIEGQAGSSAVCANGAAAHLIHPGDIVIIASFGFLADGPACESHQPKVVFVDAENRITATGAEVPGPERREPLSAAIRGHTGSP
ncbi:MAG: aspartate 1-decarboxylase [Pirellulaceae bacterium]|nr:MAG: aspartate 1-decarboxylase [Pirellulaceae bacterium]